MGYNPKLESFYSFITLQVVVDMVDQVKIYNKHSIANPNNTIV